uniref:Putative secreted protein n=1 Tax=Xenopsylla cheopis TaxID=163159 RepID=A0A6M2DVZ5_XENCH
MLSVHQLQVNACVLLVILGKRVLSLVLVVFMVMAAPELVLAKIIPRARTRLDSVLVSLDGKGLSVIDLAVMASTATIVPRIVSALMEQLAIHKMVLARVLQVTKENYAKGGAKLAHLASTAPKNVTANLKTV